VGMGPFFSGYFPVYGHVNFLFVHPSLAPPCYIVRVVYITAVVESPALPAFFLTDVDARLLFTRGAGPPDAELLSYPSSCLQLLFNLSTVIRDPPQLSVGAQATFFGPHVWIHTY